MKKIILLALGLFMLIGCNCDDEAPVEGAFPREISFTNIAKGAGNGSGDIKKSNLVIKNQKEWKDLMAEMKSAMNIQFEEKDIDFSQFYVVAVILEVKGNGWTIEVTEIKEYKENVIVTMKNTPMMNSVITQPYHIVKIPKIDKEFIFKE